MALNVQTEITNITSYTAVLTAADIRSALGELVLKQLPAPPTGATQVDLAYTFNQEQGTDAIDVHSVGVTVTVNHVLPPNPDRVMAVTRRQAMLALIEADLDEQVDAAIEAIADLKARKSMRTWYEDSPVFHRDSAQLTMLAAAVGLTDERIDELFARAAQL